MGIRVSRLTKQFHTFTAVDDVSFEIRTGEMVAFLGPSGSGKSTILRIIAGLEEADSGSVYLDDQAADSLRARDRGVGFVFQHYALFRHMTVFENIAFGLRVQKVPSQQCRARVMDLIELVGLKGLERRYPAQLSGGQRQRVALARALAPRPRLLLLDEPFSAVDAKVREELRHWLRRMHDEVGVTSIFVTHDQEEAFLIADRVMIINNGRLEQEGTPTEILDRPATEFVARFVGETNLLESVVSGGQASIGALRLAVPDFAEGTPIHVVIRSYDLKFWRQDPGMATVTRVLPLGDRVKVEAQVDGNGALIAQFPRRSSLLTGIEVGSRIHVEPTTIRAYPVGAPAREANGEPAAAGLEAHHPAEKRALSG